MLFTSQKKKFQYFSQVRKKYFNAFQYYFSWLDFFSNPNLRSQKFKPNLKMPKDTHVKKSFSFLLWKLWLTLPNKKIPKETHVKNSFSFLLWILWLTLHTLVTFATKLFNILKVENSHLSNNTKNCLGTDFIKKNNFS